MSYRMNESMNDQGVCITAPATPGWLKMLLSQDNLPKHGFILWNCKTFFSWDFHNDYFAATIWALLGKLTSPRATPNSLQVHHHCHRQCYCDCDCHCVIGIGSLGLCHYNCVIVSPCHPVIVSSCHPVIVSPCHPVIVSSCHRHRHYREGRAEARKRQVKTGTFDAGQRLCGKCINFT